MKRRWVIVTHKHLDPDATGATFLLKNYGEKKFPGISRAKVLFWSGGEEFNRMGENSNILTVDVGGGRFDHHPADRYPDQCAVTLVAKHLGIQERPELRNLIRYIKNHDLHGTRAPLDFADFIQCLNKRYSGEDRKVLEYGFAIIEAKIALEKKGIERDTKSAIRLLEQWLKEKRILSNDLGARQIRRYLNALKNGNKRDFDFAEIIQGLEIVQNSEEKVRSIAFELLDAKHEEQRALFGRASIDLLKARVTVIQSKKERTIKGKKFVVVSGGSDEQGFSRLARSAKYGYNAAIIIQRNSNGRTLIFTNKRHDTARALKNIVAMIRLEEQLWQNKRRLTVDFSRLSKPGKIREVPNWYFQKENHLGGGKLLNGSLTAPDIAVTKIPLGRVRQIVETALRLGRNFDWNKWVVRRLSKANFLKLCVV